MTSPTNTTDPTRPGPGSGKAVPVALVGVAVAVVAVFGYWMFFRPVPGGPLPDAAPAGRPFPPDPRLGYAGPFHNVAPDVRYVGDATCAGCHADIARTYARHPMGRSTVPVARAAAPPTDPDHHNPFEAFGIQFRVDGASHRQTQLDANGRPIYEFAQQVSHVVGSGTRGHSYLTVRDGFVFQTPVSWFSQKQVWDLSPGFPPWARAGRQIPAACLYCHADRVEPVEGTRNRYREPVFGSHAAIGCERCHGPGELHARTAARDDIVDPKRLAPPLREAVCQQCHLEGAARVLRRGRGLNDFRPGMPLEEFWSVFARGHGTGEENKAVNHVEQMYQSRCFRVSPADRKLGCTSCHDPHEAVAPENRVAFYRGRCLQCHAAPRTGCAVPESARRKTQADDSCIACHMPRAATSDIAHIAATDHRVIRAAGREPPPPPGPRPATDLGLLDFFRGTPDTTDVGLGRDLGVAVHQLVLRGSPLTETDGELAVGLLDRAAAECPADLDAWEAKGKLLETLRRPGPAVAAYEAVLRQNSRHESALVALGTIHRDHGQTREAVEYWRRAVEVNPWTAEYRRNLVVHLADLGAWDELGPHCRRWQELDPASVEARCMWVGYLIRTGRKAEAVAEFDKVRALRPPDLPRLDAWFARQVR